MYKCILTDDVPPPGAYDPKFDDKIKGLAINKSERFHEKAITNAEHNLSLSNKSVNKAVTIFKTVSNLNLFGKGGINLTHNKTEIFLASTSQKY